MVTDEQHDLDHEATRLGGQFSGLVDALVELATFREGMPTGPVRDALVAFAEVLNARADEAKVRLDAAIDRHAASYRTEQS